MNRPNEADRNGAGKTGADGRVVPGKGAQKKGASGVIPNAELPGEIPHPLGTHFWVVDQINGQMASVEVDGSGMMTVPVWMLPKDVAEGDVLRVKQDRRIDRSILMIVDDEDEQRRRLAESKVQVSVRSPNDTPGDVTL